MGGRVEVYLSQSYCRTNPSRCDGENRLGLCCQQDLRFLEIALGNSTWKQLCGSGQVLLTSLEFFICKMGEIIPMSLSYYNN